MRILITGGFGFVGGRMAQHMQSAGHDVVLGSRQVVAPPPIWLPDSHVVRTSWEDPTALEQICRDVDLLIHAAGMNAQDCSADPVAALEFNGLNTARLVAATKNSDIKRIIYLSTAHVYSNPLDGQIDEDTCPRNPHPYATSHIAGENAVLDVRSGVPCDRIVLRLSNIFGTPVTRDVNCWMLLANDLCRQVVTSKKMVLRSGGVQQRDFIPMDAFVKIFDEQIINELGKSLNGVFNVGSGVSLSVLEMALKIQKRCQITLGFEPALETRSGSTQPEQNSFLEYCTKRLAKSEATSETTIVVDAEIDGLLRFCESTFG